MFTRPASDEYSSYQNQYVSIVPDGNIVELLERQQQETVDYYASLTEQQALYRYAEGKWSLKEVLGHIADTEAIMSYRLLRIARGDLTALPGFEQDDYIEPASFDTLSNDELLERYTSIRRSTLSLLRTLPVTAPARRGIVNNNEITVNALAYIISGHELHHVKMIRERYTV
ncbi:DinB family protein [Paenibacillus harenae]|uniref:DinB-like domain-containing protein n=1 Tax=Paenibacillus harenae TaxID=306543 RepID=A0ABT9U7P3_PAEHA|nr:DinB family protein [Paenibacillus harenae]MDQ0115657.1 hypothetical protein [Paenibacillus harenae]